MIRNETMDDERDGATVANPLCGAPVHLVDVVSSSIVVDLYEESAKVDVSRFFEPVGSEIEIYQCSETGYRFYSPLSLAGDGAFYDSLQKAGNYYPGWKVEYDFAISRIKSKDSDTVLQVLDVGCGNGMFLDKVKELGVDGRGIEFNRTALDYCLSKGLDVIDDDIVAHAEVNQEKYDVVCVFQVLEHVPEVQAFIKACLACLKEGGELIIAVPNNEPYYAKFHKYSSMNLPPHHMGLWNIESLKSLQGCFDVKFQDSVHYESLSVLKVGYYRALSTFLENGRAAGRRNAIFLFSVLFYATKAAWDRLYSDQGKYGRVAVSYLK